jgi:hypothetical protein
MNNFCDMSELTVNSDQVHVEPHLRVAGQTLIVCDEEIKPESCKHDSGLSSQTTFRKPKSEFNT